MSEPARTTADDIRLGGPSGVDDPRPAAATPRAAVERGVGPVDPYCPAGTVPVEEGELVAAGRVRGIGPSGVAAGTPRRARAEHRIAVPPAEYPPRRATIPPPATQDPPAPRAGPGEDDRPESSFPPTPRPAPTTAAPMDDDG